MKILLLSLACLLIAIEGVSAETVLIEDTFADEGGRTFSPRTPDGATIESRPYLRAPTKASYTSTVSNGHAHLQTNLGVAVSISNGASYVKPAQLRISMTFDMGSIEDSSPSRPGRGVYLGFWSVLPEGTADSEGNMYGVFVNPATGQLNLWNGGASSNAAPQQTLNHIGPWSGSGTSHTISYEIDIDGSATGTAGNIYNFVLDGVSYAWTATNLFAGAHTAFAGIGVSSGTANTVANIDSWSLQLASEKPGTPAITR